MSIKHFEEKRRAKEHMIHSALVAYHGWKLDKDGVPFYKIDDVAYRMVAEREFMFLEYLDVSKPIDFLCEFNFDDESVKEHAKAFHEKMCAIIYA